MKKRIISSRYIDKCICIIEENCYNSPSQCFTGKALHDFCSKPKNTYALRLLEASQEIRVSHADGGFNPLAVWLESKGVLHSYTKREKSISAVKGFIAGIISTIISTTLIPFLFKALILLL